jgi:type IV pilus assembly protein PilN
MAYINLLPWREAARKAKQREFLTILATVCVLSFALMFGVSMVFGGKVTGQLKRNAYIDAEIKVLDARIAEIKKLEESKANLQQRMALIEQLQSSRNLGTQVFGEVAKTVPAGIYLAELEKKQTSVLIVGKSESNNRLSYMIRQIEDSPLLKFVNLQSITAGKGETQVLSDFTMQLSVDGFADLEDKNEEEGTKP